MAIGEPIQGMRVRSSDGANLGKIIGIEPGSFVVEKGFFFPKDYTVPRSLVADVRDDEVWLSASRADLEREQAYEEPAGEHGGHAHERGAEGYRKGEQRMTLSEEELEARKRVREAGEVTVRKEVKTEHRQIDVPVTKEEVHVERVPASGEARARGGEFEEETLRVPVREEEVEVTKKPRVREEVRVSKTARQEERRAEGEVRREEADVERTDEPHGERWDKER
jgi:uncharacterized protein (TIGR02271 family)